MTPRQKFSNDDWEIVLARLQKAKDLISNEPSDEDLDQAVISSYPCGEYLINVCLEVVLGEKKPPKDHSHPQRAKELMALGHLNGDYEKALLALGKYEKKARYLGYNASKNAASLHYPRSAVQVCLDALDSLALEVAAILKTQGLI